MDIKLYIGAHNTSANTVISTLEKNLALFAEQRIFIADSKLAIKHLSAAQKAVVEGADLVSVQKKLIAALTNETDVDTLVIVNPNILGTASRPFGKGLFYPRTSGLVQQLQNLFQGLNMQIYFSVRDPSMFIPRCYSESLLGASFSKFEDYISELDLAALRWSSLLHRLQGKQDDIPVTVWRHEDYPRIWRDVIQAITNVDNSQDLRSPPKSPANNLTLHGAQLFNAYLEEHAPRTKEDFENTKAAFLKKFPTTDEEPAVAEWPAELMQILTDNYDDDWYYIERMEGLKTIQPRVFA